MHLPRRLCTIFPRSNAALDQWPPSNNSCTPRRAERNKRHPSLVATSIRRSAGLGLIPNPSLDGLGMRLTTVSVTYAIV